MMAYLFFAGLSNGLEMNVKGLAPQWMPALSHNRTAVVLLDVKCA